MSGPTTREGDFLAGGGEMSERIRKYDWSTTSLGPLSAWPQRLRTAVSSVLQLPVPRASQRGPDRIMTRSSRELPLTGAYQWAGDGLTADPMPAASRRAAVATARPEAPAS